MGFAAGVLVGYPAAASGRGAGTGAEIPGGFPAAILVDCPAGSAPTGRLAGSGGGGPRLEKPEGNAGGKLVGGGRDTTSSESSALTKSLLRSSAK